MPRETEQGSTKESECNNLKESAVPEVVRMKDPSAEVEESSPAPAPPSVSTESKSVAAKSAIPSTTTGTSGEALILFDTALLETLQQQYRLPGTYIGVRRIRPSTREVQQKAFANVSPKVVLPPISYTVTTEDGRERRMTATEKRAAKEERTKLYKALLQQAKEKQQQEREARTTQTEKETARDEDDAAGATQSQELPTTTKASLEDLSLEKRLATEQADAKDRDRYYYFKTSQTSLEQELADLRGERNGVPPILLSPAQACLLTASHQSPPPVLDDDYALQWATDLRQSMEPALTQRHSEDMRGLVYDVVPEVWKRFRPTFDVDDIPSLDARSTDKETDKKDHSRDTLSCAIGPTEDPDWPILMRALYRGRGLHVGCGAKFGSDVLLYDGPRSKRHAFAGLRLVRRQARIPRAYDMAGFVRCLNTANKLALLAVVIDQKRVAILDLALVKIDTSRPTKRMKTLEERLELLDKAKV